MITFNSLGDDDTNDASIASPIMMMFGTIISGFTYIIKYELYINKLKSILNRLRLFNYYV